MQLIKVYSKQSAETENTAAWIQAKYGRKCENNNIACIVFLYIQIFVLLKSNFKLLNSIVLV